MSRCADDVASPELLHRVDTEGYRSYRDTVCGQPLTTTWLVGGRLIYERKQIAEGGEVVTCLGCLAR